MVLARFVLTHCYITCPEVSQHPFHQLIGTAMVTTFAVVYANIHMIFIEWNIVYSFKQCIRLYNRFLDDGICFWVGSDADFIVFSEAPEALGKGDPSPLGGGVKAKAAPLLDSDDLDEAIQVTLGAIYRCLPWATSLCRSQTKQFIMRYTASPVTHLHIYLWARFMFEKLFQSLLRRACRED